MREAQSTKFKAQNKRNRRLAAACLIFWPWILYFEPWSRNPGQFEQDLKDEKDLRICSESPWGRRMLSFHPFNLFNPVQNRPGSLCRSYGSVSCPIKKISGDSCRLVVFFMARQVVPRSILKSCPRQLDFFFPVFYSAGMEQLKINVMEKLLNANDKIAEQLRQYLKEKGIFYVNLMSSPGAGKTSLIERTVEHLDKRFGVVEGDIQTTLDAERIARLGVKAYQINTGPFGGDCHLEAGWVRSAIDAMGIDDIDTLFVENIGNLVCPAEFDVGAHTNAVVLSVTEGEDKPLKYPLAFRVTSLCLVTKIDLLPHLDISMDRLRHNIHSVNPEMQIIPCSAKTGEGFEPWYEFLRKGHNQPKE